MTYTVTVTSQGQISIPAPFRKKYSLLGGTKLHVAEDKGGLFLEPEVDFLSLRGSIKTKKKIDIHKIRKQMAKDLALKYLGKDYKRKNGQLRPRSF
jgi:AbrB family looped-hinge helix DNA binding protein